MSKIPKPQLLTTINRRKTLRKQGPYISFAFELTNKLEVPEWLENLDGADGTDNRNLNNFISEWKQK